MANSDQPPICMRQASSSLSLLSNWYTCHNIQGSVIMHKILHHDPPFFLSQRENNNTTCLKYRRTSYTTPPPRTASRLVGGVQLESLVVCCTLGAASRASSPLPSPPF